MTWVFATVELARRAGLLHGDQHRPPVRATALVQRPVAGCGCAVGGEGCAVKLQVRGLYEQPVRICESGIPRRQSDSEHGRRLRIDSVAVLHVRFDHRRSIGIRLEVIRKGLKRDSTGDHVAVNHDAEVDSDSGMTARVVDGRCAHASLPEVGVPV